MLNDVKLILKDGDWDTIIRIFIRAQFFCIAILIAMMLFQVFKFGICDPILQNMEQVARHVFE